MQRILALLAAGIMAASVAIFGALALIGGTRGGDAFEDCRRGKVAGGAASIGGPFTLTAADGRRVTDAEAITGPTLVYFGYGFCPDICPTDLSRNALAAETLSEQGIEARQVFITIDPERDTPEAVGAFTNAIDPAILGLTGTAAEIKAAAAAYKVFYRKAGDDADYYLMDHSTFTYLMAPGHGLLEFYGSEVAPDDLAASVACFAQRL